MLQIFNDVFKGDGFYEKKFSKEVKVCKINISWMSV